MATPPNYNLGSTGEFPSDRRSTDGSSIVNLMPSLVMNPDERPTIIGATPPALTQLIAGQKLGHFELIETIGRGGMATVLKARDLELGRIVALKILPPETARDSESVTRFKQEARSAARLDSDHIARVYFCGEDRGLHFIAFEFVAGDNLRVVMQSGQLSPGLAVRYMLHVALGLKHAAERGVVHRDIKPSNILITPESQAKIVDMGLARHLSSAAGGVTQSGVTLGTFDYISPEQALDPRRADLRSDIYSLGCTFYHALTGTPPVPEGTAAKKLHSHQYDAPVDPRDLNPAVPDSLAAVLAKMMAKDPARRYQTAEELIEDLQAVAVACGYTNEVPLPDGASVKAAPSLAAPRSNLPISWLLAASSVAIALVVIFGRPTSEPTSTSPPWGDSPTATRPVLPEATASLSVAVEGSKAVLTVTQLADAMNAGDTVAVKLRSGVTYDLRTLPAAITFGGMSLTLEAEGPGPPPALKLFAGGGRSLTLANCRSIVLRGLDLEFSEQNIDGTIPVQEQSGIAFENGSRILIQGCRVSGAGAAEFTAISVASSAEITVQNSLFNPGTSRTAFALDPTVRADFQDCAFAPQSAAIRLTGGESDSAAGEVKLGNCTFLIEQGSAIIVDSTAPMKIQAGHCLFAAAEAKAPAMPGEPRAALGTVMRCIGEATATFSTIASQINGYYAVAPLALGTKTFTLADAPATTFSDPTARWLTRSPWSASDPRPLVGGSEPASAFRLSLQDSRLRLPPSTAAVILGARAIGAIDNRIYPGPWPPERAQTVKAAATERIVWPEAEADDAQSRLYPTFAAAYAALMPGETLSVAVTGPVPLPILAEKTLRATIRAATGFKPVLVADGPSFTIDAALFRLADGELTFEGLEIRLKDRQAIVHVAAGTTCTFRHCILTLSEKDDAPSAAVVIPDATREMRMPVGSDDTPRILFTDTILRGDGRAVWVQAARTFDITFDNSAAALNGSLVVLDAPEKAPSGETPKGKLHLKHSTVVLNEALVNIKAGRTTGGAPAFVTVDTEACLFAAADSRSTATPLLLLEDVEPMADLAKYLAWSGRGSVYSYSETAPAVEWRTGSDATASNYDWPQWLRFTHDDGKHVARIRFTKGSLKAKMAEAEAADFALSIANPLDAGADVEKLP